MRPPGEISHFSARLGMGAAVFGSSRVRPSNTDETMRISAMPVMSAGSRVSGSLSLMMTRSAGASLRPQLVRKKAAKRTNRPACATRRNPLRTFGRELAGKFIVDYFGGMLVDGVVRVGTFVDTGG